MALDGAGIRHGGSYSSSRGIDMNRMLRLAVVAFSVATLGVWSLPALHAQQLISPGNSNGKKDKDDDQKNNKNDKGKNNNSSSNNNSNNNQSNQNKNQGNKSSNQSNQ